MPTSVRYALCTAVAFWPASVAAWVRIPTIQKYGPVGLPPSKNKKKKSKTARRRK